MLRSKLEDVRGLTGQSFVRYDMGEVVARTRSGVVYRAVDRKNGRQVALKLFDPGFFANDAQQERFLRAMRTMIHVSHPHLVKLYGAGRSRGVCFTAAEFVEGVSATQLIERIGVAGMLDWRRVWRIGLHVARALEFAENRALLHRNIQPGNILIGDLDGCAKLGDLMLARAIDAAGHERITRRGEVVGELQWLSPEQLDGELNVDARADLYSLGAMLYALLTGRPPFAGRVSELVRRTRTEPPEPITKFHLAVPARLEGTVLKLLEKRRDERFATATLLREELEAFGRYHGLE